MKKSVLCSISTRGRYDSTLPMTVQSVICQTRKPDKLVIFDDNDEPQDLRNHDVYRQMFPMLQSKGIDWVVVFGGKKGQHHNHQLANTMGYDWVWRLDDDTFAEPNVLATLCSYVNDDVGAIAGSVMTPSFTESFQPGVLATGRISEIDNEYNPQWFERNSVLEVEHLHCSFLYRAGVHDYNLNLSRVAHREETMFSHGLYRKGYRLLVVPNAVTWHLKMNGGGIRTDNRKKYYDFDEEVFQFFLRGQDCNVVVLDNGMGDHLIFKRLLGEIQNPMLFTCYPEILPGRSIADAKDFFVDIGRWNLYQRMADWRWNDSLENAFRKLYLGAKP